MKPQKKECENCSKTITSIDDLFLIGGNHYCGSCIVECRECGELIPINQNIYDDCCERCYKKKRVCDNCGALKKENSIYYYQEKFLCKDCVSELLYDLECEIMDMKDFLQECE